MTPEEFATAIRAYCLQTHGSVTSYGRTEEHNAAVGGVAGSPHIHWVAADVVYDATRMLPQTHDTIAEGLGLHIVHENDHDHVQPENWQNQP